MGIIKDIKADTAVQAARKAAKEGRRVMLYRQNVPATAGALSGEISDVSVVIAAIEGAGWRLDQMSFDGRQSSNGAVLLLFRAAPPQRPAPPPQQQAAAPLAGYVHPAARQR